MRHLPIFITLAVTALPVMAEHLVILHTNDTHSQIDPTGDGLGGVARRKAAIDSVRMAEPEVMLVDAGDVVQGTLFFNLYKGEVEQKLMNLMGYELGILGNHEFDNGVEALAEMLRGANAKQISTNYDLRSTPLDTLFSTYAMRQVGVKNVAFIGINLNPEGMIAPENSRGVIYNDAIASANLAARWLREEMGADAVVALTHIGYNPEAGIGDRELATRTRGIDVIIGGHSHDRLDPADSATVRVPNLDGVPVLVVQTGKQGKYLGKIDLNLDDNSATYELLPIDSRYDKELDPQVDLLLAPYRRGVDSLMRVPVAYAARELKSDEMPLLNFMADFVYDRGSQLAEGIDMAIINKGGLRRGLGPGTVTKGEIMSMLPFDNRIWVLDVPGKSLRSVFNVMAKTRGNGISSQARATFDPETLEVKEITINGEPLDDERIYRVATIDYLAKGGDYMSGLKDGTVIARSGQGLSADVIDYLQSGVPFGYDTTVRMRQQ